MTQQQPNKSRNWPAIIGFVGVALVLLLWWLIPGKPIEHVEPITIDPNVALKKQVARITRERDSLKIIAKRYDTLSRAKVADYRTIKTRAGDVTKMPCDTVKKYYPIIVQACDSIISQDSALISVLNDVMTADSAIISNQREIIANDSIRIDDLDHKARRYKRQRNVVAGVGAIGWFLALFR